MNRFQDSLGWVWETKRRFIRIVSIYIITEMRRGMMMMILGHDNGLSSTPSLDDDSKQAAGGGSRHASSDGPISPAPRRTIVAASVPTAHPHPQPPLQHKLSKYVSNSVFFYRW